MLQRSFTSWDGASLHYRAWLPDTWSVIPAQNRTALLLFHRGHEHSARWAETVDSLRPLLPPTTAFFGWDQRGHGDSSGDRGDAPSVGAVTRDAHAWAQHLTAAHSFSLTNALALAHSVGAVIAAAWVHDYAPPLRGIILAAPAFKVRLYVPLALPFLRLKQKALGPGYVKSYVKASMLTHDPDQAAAYRADKAIFRQISVRMLLGLNDTADRLLADAGAIETPTLLLSAGRDWIVDNAAIAAFYARLGSQTKRLDHLPDFYHGLFHEKDRQQVIEKIAPFINDCLQRPSRGGSIMNGELLRRDHGGHTRAEFDLLQLPPRHPLKWSANRTFLRTAGRLSAGIRLGWQAGFDSGVMLDYIYQNRSKGNLLLGKIIDRFFLDAIGWRGIRQRRMHLEATLRSLILQQRAANPDAKIRILDIAAGPARYLLSLLAQLPGHLPHIDLILRDYQSVNLDAARALARSLNLPNITFEQANAFADPPVPTPGGPITLAIASGLYELFPDNALIRRSLHALSTLLPPNAHLVYTCQPWHPQVEFIARVLRNREGQPWIMRRRSQAEMDSLVEHAGFEKIDGVADDWGMFTVSVARRTADGPTPAEHP